MVLDSGKSKNIDQEDQILIVFRKLIRQWTPLRIQQFENKGTIQVTQEENGFLFLNVSALKVDLDDLKPGCSFDLMFFYEGKLYLASTRCVGSGKLDGTPTLKVTMPKSCRLQDDFQLTYCHVPQECRAVFTNHFNKVRDALIVNIGEFGVDIHAEFNIHEEINVGDSTFLTLCLEKGTQIQAEGKVIYFVELGQTMAGVEFTKIDASSKADIVDWIRNSTATKEKNDLEEYLTNWRPPVRGLRKPRPALKKKGYDYSDYPTVLFEGAPTILIVGNDYDFLGKLGHLLRDEYGVLVSKGRLQNLEEIHETYAPILTLVDESLGTVSGFDLCSRIIENINSDQPVVIFGSKKDLDEKSNKAMAAGAIGYCPVKPFLVRLIKEKIREFCDMVS